MLQQIYLSAKILLCVVLSVCLIIATHDWRSITGALHPAAENLNSATASVADAASSVKDTAASAKKYVDYQVGYLERPEYQKWLAASLQTPAMFNGTARLLNRTTIPALNGDLTSLNSATAALREFIADTDKNTNGPGGLLPQATAVLQKVGLSVRDFDAFVQDEGDLIEGTTFDARKLLNDFRVDSFLNDLAASGGNANRISADLATISHNFAEASAQAPEIAELWAKMMRTTSKLQKWLYLARILALVGPVFFGPFAQ